MMRTTATLDIDREQVTWPPAARAAAKPLGVLGLAALIAVLAISYRDTGHFRHFLHTYLASYCYFLSISLGALIFVAWQHVSKAGWSVTVRRLAEVLAGAIPLWAVLFLPILVPMLWGNHSLYVWNDAKAVAADELLRHKAPYLNLPFFIARCAGYFVIWALLARFFLGRSVQQDRSGLLTLTLRMERMSPAALLLLAVTVTFAAFDWLMSLEPHWFSTIYGLYYFAGAMVGALAAIILLAIACQSAGRLQHLVTVEHYHDLGKFLFAFVVFWGYMAFSQYLLIWYANLPEETVWYAPRHTGAWGTVSLVLVFGHLLIPFLGMMSRHAKRRKWLLGFWAVWLLVVHWIDLYWLVMPSFDAARVPFGLLDVACLAGQGCVFFAAVVWSGSGEALVPLRDPRLAESLAFENI